MRSARDLPAKSRATDEENMRASLKSSLAISSGILTRIMEAEAAGAAVAFTRLRQRDPSAWSAEPDVQEKISNRLGWLTSPVEMAESLDRLRACADAVKRDHFTDVVVLGMGGSSLAPEVLRAVLGASPGCPRMHVLDSTDPAAIEAASTHPATSLYLLASKSGTTIEPNSLAAHFRRRLVDAGVTRWADHFAALTDEGTPLAARARDEGFRDLFLNPTDIGGRYSALSFFGLVPSAMMGQEVSALLAWGAAMLAAAEDDSSDLTANPAAALGLAMGACARAGRDKLTILLPPSLEPLGLWIEQLVAESTGKNGTGIIPITGEAPIPGSRYGDDRLFVVVTDSTAGAGGLNADRLSGLDAERVPTLRLHVPEPLAIGAEFVRWEIATAVAGALLQVNPFDEPNVQQAKDATGRLLATYRSLGRLPLRCDETMANGASLAVSAAARQRLRQSEGAAMLTTLAAGDYLAVLAYFGPDDDLAHAIQEFRLAVRDRTGVATTVGYGPRYLHSTGQLHKGGPATGVFILFTAPPVRDIDIPGERYSFATLELAQALGDFASLEASNRRALHVHLPSPDARLLREVTGSLLGHLA